MIEIGLKKSLMLSVILLVGLSVSLSSAVLYQTNKSAITEQIIAESKNYVASKAAIIETLINEKVGGISKLADSFQDSFVSGTEQEIIEQTYFLANAMNSESAMIAFDNGDAYWNGGNASNGWPNHKLDGDATQRPWYPKGRAPGKAILTDPYLGTDGGYWLTVVDKTKGGAITVDLSLEFMDNLVKNSNELPGATAMILEEDTTLLASSSKAIKAGEKASDFEWFEEATLRAVQKKSAAEEYILNGVEKILFSHEINVGGKRWFFTIGLDKTVAFAALSEAKAEAVFVTVLACAISVAIAFVLVQVLYKPIIALKETVTSLSSGEADLTQRVNVKSNDDLGQIAKSINRFIANIQQIMQDLQVATNTLEGKVNQVQAQSQRNSKILRNHILETEQIVTAIEEMNSTANSMAGDAANTAAITQQAKKTGDESRRIVQQSQKTVSALITDVERAESNVQNMSNETQGINNILSVIGGIAEQTNLLALNAAIEAARAGEQGRGFAVVADEVRSLASRTKDSTVEIENALTSLLKGTQEVVDSMGVTKARCQETANGSEEVVSSLKSMTEFANSINNYSTQIAAAAEEQSHVTHELSRNMATISDIVGELDQSVNQALLDAGEISEVNARLGGIVNRFKL